MRRIYLSGQQGRSEMFDHLLDHFPEGSRYNVDEYTIGIIENISPTEEDTLADVCSIERTFFDNHRSGDHEETDTETCKQLRGWYYDPDTRECIGKTVISYCKLPLNVYLFLVNTPTIFPPRIQKRTRTGTQNVRSHLRFRHAINRGGLLMPGLLRCAFCYDVEHISGGCPERGALGSRRYSSLEESGRAPHDICIPMDVLQNAFEHDWQVRLIFHNKWTIFPKRELLYLLSNSAHETNFRRLDTIIKDLCLFKTRKLQDPDLQDTNGQAQLIESLFDIQVELSLLRQHVDETIFYTKDSVRDFYDQLKKDGSGIKMRSTPLDGLQQIQEKGGALNTFFMDNIQLILSIISIRDAQYSIRQTKYGIVLTVLAAIYLPLSLATSVFGMNLAELTGSGPPAWVFGVVCGSTFVLTCIAVAITFRRPIAQFFRVTAPTLSLRNSSFRVASELKIGNPDLEKIRS